MKTICTISLLAEIPEPLYQSAQSYLELHRDWDSDRLIAAAIELFLSQNGGCEVDRGSGRRAA